jgi:hypothetical protein
MSTAIANQRQHICILVLSPIARDARVLRQIEYLAPHYYITVIGYGEAPPEWAGRVAWHNILGGRWSQLFDRTIRLIVVALGRIVPPAYTLEYILTTWAHRARRAVRQANADAYHANDWDTLPLVVPHVPTSGVKLVFDAHEYPLGQQHSWLRRFILNPRARYFLKRYVHSADRMITVSPVLVDKYKDVFGVSSDVVLSAPKTYQAPPSDVQADTIHLVHQGAANRRRYIELTVELMRNLDARFHLHFYLLNNHPDYVAELKALAKNIAPERIHFYDPIPPTQITQTINAYDIGIFILKPNTLNHAAALPNKFFEFINASLAVCIGPSPAMKAVAEQYDFSIISDTFDIEVIAQQLSALTPDDIMRMKQNASKAAQDLNADVEMQKVVDLYANLLA